MTVTQYASLAKKKKKKIEPTDEFNGPARHTKKRKETNSLDTTTRRTRYSDVTQTFKRKLPFEKENKQKKIQSNKNKHSTDYWHRRFSNVNKGGQGVCQSFLYLSLSPLAFKRERGTGATN